MSAKCQKRTLGPKTRDILECESRLIHDSQNVVRNLRLNAEAWSMEVVKAGWMTDW
jgi:hypothetical protein